MTSLANKYRPKHFSDVMGQAEEVAVIEHIIQEGWEPPAIALTGPYGTGKTTLARLTARAALCYNRNGHEPCGTCESCIAMDRDNNPGYEEIDAASHGKVEDTRAMKDLIAYRSTSSRRLVTYDESHMLTQQAQNALLQTLEEGVPGVTFIFCTTDPVKMLPTIRSRCVILQMKLMTAGQIKDRLQTVAKAEGFKIEDRAAALIGTYSRGHVRDALILLEQLGRTTKGDITEDAARIYLRLDRLDEVYQLLTETEKVPAVEKLETLLCTYSPRELQELIGEILLAAYKLKAGIEPASATDKAWLKRVVDARGDNALGQAEELLALRTDFATITYATAAFTNILIEDRGGRERPKRSLSPCGPAAASPATGQMRRKPGK